MSRHDLTPEPVRPSSRNGRRGAVSPKVIVAAVVALVGVGAVTWSVSSLQRPTRRPRMVMERPADAASPREGAKGPDDIPPGARRVEIGGPGGGGPGMGPGGGGARMFGIPAYMHPSMAESYDFPKVKDAKDVRALLDRTGESISSTLGNDDTFSWMGLSQRDKLVEAVRLAVEPLAIGTAEDYAAAVEVLRGTDTGEPRPSSRLFERLSPALAMSSFDVSNVRVSPVDTSEASPLPRRAGVSVMAIRTADSEGPTDRLTIMSIGTDEVFPDVAGFMGSKMRAVEVRVPVRTKGSSEKAGDLDLSLVMVWNEKAQGWQPADYRLFVRNGEVGTRLMPPRGERSGGPDPTGK